MPSTCDPPAPDSTEPEGLDFSLDAMSEPLPPPASVPGDPWLQRRSLGFGASDMPALLVALGLVSQPAPKYVTDRAKKTNRTKGYPRIIAEKAGLVETQGVGPAARRGTARERELLEQWRLRLLHGTATNEAERLIDPHRVRHADVAMRCAMPWVDRHCPMLTATLDAWADDVMGDEVAIELKCSASERTELTWWWQTQVLCQLAVTGAPYGLLVCGEQWAAWHGNDGPIRCWVIERDEVAITALREAARRGWQMVEDAREKAV